MTKIGNYAFSGCTSLTSIVIPDSVTEIGERAFCRCEGLTNVVIPDSVTKIGDNAFQGCEGLTSIVIPASVAVIGENIFGGVMNSRQSSIGPCPKLKNIVVDKGNKMFDSRDNCNAIIESATDTLLFGCQGTVIPDTVKVIGPYAFDICATITSIHIPSGVNSIGEGAFRACSGLESAEIPNNVTTRGSERDKERSLRVGWS